MRKFYCPVCASAVERRSLSFSCARSNGPSARLGHALQQAVDRADEPKASPRDPEWAPHFWCPNCTGPLDEYDERGVELRCPSCGLSLAAIVQVDLLEYKEHHQPPELWW